MSGDSNVVISLQVGHYANFVGAHFWNSQDLSLVNFDREKNDINYDVLFREGFVGVSERHITYAPRLVSVDLKGALGSLPVYGDLYHEVASKSKTDLLAADQSHWDHKVDIQREEVSHKSTFLKDLDAEDHCKSGAGRVDEERDMDTSSQPSDVNERGDKPEQGKTRLDEEVRVWSDFLRARFHHKTNVVVNEYQHGNAGRPFDIFGLGLDAMNYSSGSNSLYDDIEDRIHFFAEEADNLRGFQMTTDVTDGFGGVACGIVDHVRDSYGSRSVLVFPTLPTWHEEVDVRKASTILLNNALTTRSLCQKANLVAPLSLTFETYPLFQATNGRTLEGVKYDLRSKYQTSAILSTAYDALTTPWRKLNGSYTSPSEVTSNLGAGGRVVANAGLVIPLANQKAVSLTPHCANISEGARGHACARAEEITLSESALNAFASNSALTSSSCACHIGAPYPNDMFDQTANATVSALTVLQSADQAGNYVGQLAKRAAKVNIRKFQRFAEAGLEEDELEAAVDDLISLSECYNNEQ